MKINNLGMFFDESGKKYEVLERVKQISTSKIGAGYKTIDGFKDYETSCGIPVNVRKDSVFVTWEDVILKPVD